MSQYKHRVRMPQDPQYPMESEFMGSPTRPVLTSDGAGLQTYEYSPQIVSHKGWFEVSSAALLRLSRLSDAERQLQEIRLEVEEACELDSETEVVPTSAYSEARFLLNAAPFVLPMPDIVWLEDGGIGFEWRAKNGKGIGTISLYGDNQVIYGASLGSTRRVKGTLALSNPASLRHLFTVLSLLYSQ